MKDTGLETGSGVSTGGLLTTFVGVRLDESSEVKITGAGLTIFVLRMVT